ncbi:MAG TPA: hypothetical protein DCS48_11080 [Desulfovibrio sp.]|nr:hypothetical protein [Desulfovibrio sp.]
MDYAQKLEWQKKGIKKPLLTGAVGRLVIRVFEALENKNDIERRGVSMFKFLKKAWVGFRAETEDKLQEEAQQDSQGSMTAQEQEEIVSKIEMEDFFKADTSSGSTESDIQYIESSSEAGTYYDVDIINMTCTCIDWTTRRNGYSIDDPLRVCKHLAQATGLPKFSAPNQYSKPRKIKKKKSPHGKRKRHELGDGVWYTKCPYNSRSLNVETSEGTYEYSLWNNAWWGKIPTDDLKIARQIHGLPDDLPIDAIQTVKWIILNTAEVEVYGVVEGEKIRAAIKCIKSSLWHEIHFNRKTMYINTGLAELFKSKHAKQQSKRVHKFLHMEKAISHWVTEEKKAIREMNFPKESLSKKNKLNDFVSSASLKRDIKITVKSKREKIKTQKNALPKQTNKEKFNPNNGNANKIYTKQTSAGFRFCYQIIKDRDYKVLIKGVGYTYLSDCGKWQKRKAPPNELEILLVLFDLPKVIPEGDVKTVKLSSRNKQLNWIAVGEVESTEVTAYFNLKKIKYNCKFHFAEEEYYCGLENKAIYKENPAKGSHELKMLHLGPALAYWIIEQVGRACGRAKLPNPLFNMNS